MLNQKRKIIGVLLLLVLVFMLTMQKKDQIEVKAFKTENPVFLNNTEKPELAVSKDGSNVKELIYKVQKLDENVLKLREDLNNEEKIKSLIDKK